MSAAVKHPCDHGKPDLLEWAKVFDEKLPGHRVEILGGMITVTPLPDACHAVALTDLTLALLPVHNEKTAVVQRLGLRLPGAPFDFAIPDLAIVDTDCEEQQPEWNLYDPAFFRLVLEVTSVNYALDTETKIAAYASAGIPVYVIVDRKYLRLHVLTDPVDNWYRSHRFYDPGERAALPASLGAEIELDVGAIIERAGYCS